MTYAGKRYILPASVMIRIPYKGRLIECSTSAEAIEVLKHIDADERGRNPTVLSLMESVGSMVSRKSPWTRSLFWKFIDNLGEAQKCVLSLLVTKHKVTDVELRKALKVESNQALAGVLSGISKQAGVLDIPARAVYVVEDERKDGVLAKTYAIAGDFFQMAIDMNWTGDTE